MARLTLLQKAAAVAAIVGAAAGVFGLFKWSNARSVQSGTGNVQSDVTASTGSVAVGHGSNQNGNAASSGQSGGVTAGLYINQVPPVTEQQKEEALSSLQSEIEELAEFPNRPDISVPRTLLEQFAVNKMPHQLFIILNKYYKETITSVPKLGEDLFKYKKNYYDFESSEYDFENQAASQIGKIVTVDIRKAWLIYFRYCLLRSAGLTKQNIVDGWNFLNYSITWDDAERVFSELTNAPSIVQAMAEKFSLQQSMLAAATSIISTYKRP